MIDKLLGRLAKFTSKKALIFGLILGAIYYFTLFDDGSATDAKIQKVMVDIKTEEAKEKESEAALKEVEQVRAAVGALSDQFKVASQQLPAEVQMSEIIRSVDALSRSSGVSVKVKEPGPAVRKDILEEIPLHLVAEGSFSEITMFLYYVSSVERITRVKNFSITIPSEERKNGSHLQFDGEITNYRFVGEEKKPQ